MKNLTPVTREEKYLHAIATHGEVNIVPVTTEEKLLDSIVRDEPIAVNPKTRMEYFLNEIVNSGQANKTYILEPGNAVVSDAGRGEYSIRFDDYTDTTYNDMIANKDKSLFMSINDAVGPITAEIDETFSVVVNGWNIQGLSTGGSTYLVYPESEDTEITPGTYTVAIYTETDGSNDSETRFLTPVTREEKYLHAIANDEIAELTPTNAEEKLLDAIMRKETISVNPKTRKEWFLAEVAEAEIISNEDSGETPPTPVL